MSVFESQYFIPQQITGCRLGSTSNIAGVYDNGDNGIGATLTTNSPTLTVNLVDVENGDSIFVGNQTNTNEKGIYVVSGVGENVVLTRRSDFQSPSQMKPGYFFTLSAGSFAGLLITVIEPQVQQVGVDSLFTKNSTAGIIPFRFARSSAFAGGSTSYAYPAQSVLSTDVALASIFSS